MRRGCPPEVREAAMVLARKGWDHETITRTMLSWAAEASENAWAWAREEDRRMSQQIDDEELEAITTADQGAR